MPRNDTNLSNMDKEILKEEIKAKLNKSACNLSNDKDFSDYILLLLEHKKSLKNIEDDLKVFLHEETIGFSSWLHETYEQFCSDNHRSDYELAIEVDTNEFNEEDEHKSKDLRYKNQREEDLRERLLKKSSKKSIASRLGPIKQDSSELVDDAQRKADVKSRLGPRITTEKEEEASVQTKFIVTLKGINESKFLKQSEDEPKVTFKRHLSDDEDSDRVAEEVFEYEAMSVDGDEGENSSVKRKPVRCTFWPSCDKGSECTFIHPNKPCEAFPNCKFGKSCHYLHPACKYDGVCTRIDCIYTHVTKRAPTILSDIKQPKVHTRKSISPNKKFKFSIKHSSESENIKVVKECKFGKLCKNPSCVYSHPQLPDKSALKWIAPKEQSQQQAQQHVI